MGAEQSREFDPDVAPQTLTARTLEAVAEYVKSGRCTKVAFMVGAGISTSAGIPDFRSPGTGLYANLERLNLPHPEAVFDISFFRENPLPFYTLAHELYPGKFRPTITHSLIRLFADKGLLLKCFTQNIDTLERAAGVPAEFMVEAHGSFASQTCIDCKAPFSTENMNAHISAATIPKCLECGGVVKPDIVFFGEALPKEFHDSVALAEQADLVIVMGSSLSVYPFAALPGRAAEGCPRLLINLEKVGGLGSRGDDVIVLGECDNGVRRFAKELGWLEELEKLWAETETEGFKAIRLKKEEEGRKWEEMGLDERVELEVERLTEEVGKGLKVAEEYRGRVEMALEKERMKTEENGNLKKEDENGGLGHVFPHMKGSI
ncbi:Sir2 histone deacetylase Hst2 [Rhizina undulata]